MTITTTTNPTMFDQKFYQAMSMRANTHYREIGRSIAIPAAVIEPLDADEYKKPIFAQSTGVYGEQDYGVDGDIMVTPKSHKLHYLAAVRSNIYWDVNDQKREASFLLQKKDDQLKEWARVADLSVWNGVYSKGFSSVGAGQGVKMNDGILTNATAVTNLDGVNSALLAQGDVYKALTKIVETIPFRYRQNFPIKLAMTSNFISNANRALFTFSDGSTEWEKFYDKFITKGINGFKVDPDIIVSDEIFGNLGDTLATDSRVLAFIPDNRVCERAYSRGFGMLGSKYNEIQGVTEAWATKLGGCVHDANGVLLTEKITWA